MLPWGSEIVHGGRNLRPWPQDDTLSDWMF
jgi:hypothetical protein